MKTTTLLFTLTTLLAGCGDPAVTPTNDSAVTDTRVPDTTVVDSARDTSTTDTAVVDANRDSAANDSAVTDARTDTGVATDSGTDGGGGIAATWANVHAGFRTYCIDCHGNAPGSGGHSMAQLDPVMAYASSQTTVSSGAPAACQGGNRGRCAGIRVHNLSMPQGRTLTTEQRTALEDLLDRWNAAGQPSQ